MIVLDTNVLSELLRPAPAPAVLAWVAARPRAALVTTAITEAEMRHGLALMPDGAGLAAAVERLLGEGLAGRVLPFDRAAAPFYAEIAAARRRVGRPIATADAQIAAIARARGARLVATRDAGGFEGCGIDLADPWAAA